MADTHIAFYSFDEVVATCGGRLDFEEFEEYEQEIDFSEMDEMLNMLANASIELTGTPLPLKVFFSAQREQQMVGKADCLDGGQAQ